MEVGTRRNQVLSSKPQSRGKDSSSTPICDEMGLFTGGKGLGRAEAQELRHKEPCVSRVAGVEAGEALEAGGDKALSSSSLWSCFPTTAPIFPVLPLSAGHTSSLGPLPGCPPPPFITTSSQGFSDLSYVAAPT